MYDFYVLYVFICMIFSFKNLFLKLNCDCELCKSLYKLFRVLISSMNMFLDAQPCSKCIPCFGLSNF